MTILHFCPREDWLAAQAHGEHRTDHLADEGFIHCSSADQVHLPATRLAPGRTDLVLLEIDTDRIPHPIRWEPGDPSDPESMRFPHVYGPIPVAAVIAVHDFPPEPDGAFSPPTHLHRARG